MLSLNSSDVVPSPQDSRRCNEECTAVKFLSSTNTISQFVANMSDSIDSIAPTSLRIDPYTKQSIHQHKSQLEHLLSFNQVLTA